jgi:HEAT repeat protein
LIKDSRAEEVIIKILDTTKDENVKLSCLEALGNIKSSTAIDKIISCYNENELFKPTVNEALGKIGSKKALNFMLERYPHEDELTKYSIIESLGNIGDIDTFFFLISELHKVTGPLSWVILSSVHQLQEKYNLDVPFDEKVKTAILNTIYDAQPEYKKAAIYLLKEFNDKEILSACLKSMGYDFELDEILRAKILSNSEQAVLSFPATLKSDLKNAEIILGLVDDVIKSLDKPVTTILNGLHLRSFIDSLSNYLNHPDEEARRLAMNLLFKIDSKTAVLFVDKMLNDDNLWNKLLLIDNLASMNDDSSLTLLYKLSKDAEIMVSKRASEIISAKTSIEN